MPRDRERDGDYEVGYGRPPRHTRFKPGQSGNPRGRKKGIGNLKTVLMEELNRPVTISEGGKPRKVPIFALAIRQNAAKAAKGDTRAFLAVLAQAERYGLLGLGEHVEPIVQMPLSPEEEALLRESLAEMRAERAETDGAP